MFPEPIKAGKTYSFREIFGFAVWYLPLCIGSLTERSFPSPLCLAFNRAGAFSTWGVSFALLLVLLFFIRSKRRHPRLYGIICTAIVFDCAAAFAMSSLGYVPGTGGEFERDYLSFFWETFFGAVGIRLSDVFLYRWGRTASVLLPALGAAMLGGSVIRSGRIFTGNKPRKGAAGSSIPRSNVPETALPPPQASFWSTGLDLRRNVPLPVALVTTALTAGLVIALLSHTFANIAATGKNDLPRILPEPGDLAGVYRSKPPTRLYLEALKMKGNRRASSIYVLLSQAARNGDTNAMTMLAELYFEGREIPTRTVALGWLKRALELHDLSALRLYIQAVDRNMAGSKDPAERFALHRLGADNGDGYSMTQLGIDYMRGRHIKRDFGEGLRWIRKAAELNDPFGLAELGFLYYRGDRVGRDWGEAHALLVSALNRTETARYPDLEVQIVRWLSRMESGIGLHGQKTSSISPDWKLSPFRPNREREL